MRTYLKWVVLGGILLIVYIWQQTYAVQMGYAVQNTQRECDRWSQSNRALQLQVNKLISLERLDKTAQEHKLAAPDQKSIVYIE